MKFKRFARKSLARLIAAILIPFALLLHMADKGWEKWHFGPSQKILRKLRDLNLNSFKRLLSFLRKLNADDSEGEQNAS